MTPTKFILITMTCILILNMSSGLLYEKLHGQALQMLIIEKGLKK